MPVKEATDRDVAALEIVRRLCRRMVWTALFSIIMIELGFVKVAVKIVSKLFFEILASQVSNQQRRKFLGEG